MDEKDNGPVDEQKRLALERTRLASVRTRLAWLRTILAIIAFAAIMLKLIKFW